MSQSTAYPDDEMLSVVTSPVISTDTGGTVTAQDRRDAFGAALKAARTKKGLSQRQLAAAAGIKDGVIGHMEKGRFGGKEGTVAALEDALDLPRGELGFHLGHVPLPPSAAGAHTIETDPSLTERERHVLLAALRALRDPIPDDDTKD